MSRSGRPTRKASEAREGAAQHGKPREASSRHIRSSVECMLWGKASGRCEFCNKALWKSSVTQEPVNTAQKAHIYSFSNTGPRGRSGIALEDLNGLDNLMLVCHECHRKIDQDADGGRYTVAMLRRMKGEHERRIERVTGIASNRRSHVLLYGANVGDHSGPLNYRDAAPALFHGRYPAEDQPLAFSTVNSAYTDSESAYWEVESENLRRKYDRSVRERVVSGDITHLSVFALAPQPLLILLGTLLGDIVPCDVYQRHREPPSWEWPAEPAMQPFEVRRPATSNTPAIVMAFSGTVTDDRVTAVLGADASIWTVTVSTPHNDLVKSPQQLSQLRAFLRPLLDEIKARHGQSTPLHVFPVMPVSAAIELGRLRTPKADMPWQIYDQVNKRGGFISALSIP